MSEVEETGKPTVDDVLQAIQQKNIGQARSHFNDLMSYKVSDALDNEKVRLASTIYSPQAAEEVYEPEVEEEEEVTLELDNEEEAVEED